MEVTRRRGRRRKNILFFGQCIFNNEDEKINQQNAQINSGLIYY